VGLRKRDAGIVTSMHPSTAPPVVKTGALTPAISIEPKERRPEPVSLRARALDQIASHPESKQPVNGARGKTSMLREVLERELALAECNAPQ
jgi:hypothetical protein